MNEWLIGLPEDQAVFVAHVAIAFVVCLGAVIGSFLNVCIYRIPIGQSIGKPRSHCPSCGRMIPWYLNVPLLSWLILRGRCASCKAPISVRYPIIETLTAMLFLMVFQMWGNPAIFGLVRLQEPLLIPVYWAFAATVVVNSAIDIDHGILLDRFSLGAMPIALALSGFFPGMHGESVWTQGLIDSAVGLVGGFAGLWIIGLIGSLVFRKEAMGFGDVKWMGLFGALFGWQACVFILICASLLGAVAGLVLLLSRKAALCSAIPFGPYLGASALIWLFWGPRLLDWYVSLIVPAAL